MKTITFFIILAVAIGVVFFIKTNTKDNAARKDAKQITARVTKVRCDQRLKGDKSLVILAFQGKSYSVFTSERKCNSCQLNMEVTAFYSSKYDKLFLEL